MHGDLGSGKCSGRRSAVGRLSWFGEWVSGEEGDLHWLFEHVGIRPTFAFATEGSIGLVGNPGVWKIMPMEWMSLAFRGLSSLDGNGFRII